MRHIRKISDYAVAGGIGAIALFGLTGCDRDNSSVQAAQEQQQGAIVIIEEVAKGEYKILDEQPSAVTRVILKDLNGVERVLSQSEIDELLRIENAKIDAGTSPMTNPQMSSGAPSLGQIILGSAAGAMLGAWIGGKLFNNQNFQNQRRTNYKSPQAYSKSVDSFKKSSTAGAKKSSKKGGFFGGGSKSTSAGG